MKSIGFWLRALGFGRAVPKPPAGSELVRLLRGLYSGHARSRKP
jgi:hypothetical protein